MYRHLGEIMENKSQNSNVEFLIENLKIQKKDAEKLDKDIRAWINRSRSNEENEFKELYDAIDSNVSDAQTSSDNRRRRRAIKKVVKHYLENSL